MVYFLPRFSIPKNIPWTQLIGCLATTLLTFSIGLMIGWVSPYLPLLTGEDSPLPITVDEASWVISMNHFGRLAGAIVGATSVEFFGSKKTLFLIVFPMICSWGSMIVADSVVWLYAARFGSGLSYGTAFSTASLYVGEVASPGIRGALISLVMLGYPLGTLVSSVMGAYLSLSHLGWISLAPTILTMILFVVVPESPHYLIRKGKMKRAENSVARYNPGVDHKVEFQSLKNFVSASSSSTFQECLREFVSPQNKKSGIIVTALCMFTHVNGLSILLFYSEVILLRGSVTVITPSTIVIILNTIGIVAGVGAIYLADTCGRKILWNTASIGSCIALMIIGLHFRLLSDGFDPVTLQYLLITGLVIWQITTNVGVNPVPNMVLGEIFPPNVKSLAACLASATSSVFALLCTKSYQPMVDTIGEAYAFWIHAVIMVSSVIFGLTLLPETKGKSLQEIQDSLTKKRVPRSVSRFVNHP